MPRGEKSSYTDKQKRTAQHIEQSYVDKGIPEDEAESRAWATVNKQDGGGKESGSGRGKSPTPATSEPRDPAKKTSRTRKAQGS